MSNLIPKQKGNISPLAQHWRSALYLFIHNIQSTQYFSTYRKKLQSVLKIIFKLCQSKLHFKNYWLPHMIIKKASLITPTYFWLLDQIKMFCVFFNARVIGLYCHNWFFLPSSIIFHPILTRTTPIFGYKWHFFTKMAPKKGNW